MTFIADEVYPDIPSPDYDESSDEEESKINYSISKNDSLDTSLNGPSDDEFIGIFDSDFLVVGLHRFLVH